MNDKQLDIISHSLGINLYHAKQSTRKRDKLLPYEFYRNYYCYGESSDSNIDQDFIDLEKEGLIKRWNQINNLYFCVTDIGISFFRDYFEKEVTNTYVPLSKSKETYQEYCSSDGCYRDFSNFLDIQLPKVERYRSWWGDDNTDLQGTIRMVSTKYDEVKGGWFKTNKDAKESYKEALKKYKTENN